MSSRMIIISAVPPKPPDFAGSDEDWRMLNEEQPMEPAFEPEPQATTPPEGPRHIPREMKPGNIEIPSWLGSEDEWEEITPSTQEPQAPVGVLPVSGDDTPAPPSVLAPGRPGSPDPYDVIMEDDFVNFGPEPEDVEPVDPSSLFEEVLPSDTPEEERNKKFSVREKIWYALNTGTPLGMVYETLPDRMRRTFVSTRTVEPDYVYWAGTGRHILVAWDHLRNDWRAFVVDRIRDAKIKEEGQ